MANPQARDVHGHEFEEISDNIEPAGNLSIEDLNRVRLTVTADLGKCTMLVRDVLELQRGSVVQLDKLAGEMTDILVNGLPLAKGEVIVIGDTLHVRVGDIVGSGERPEGLGVEGLEEEEEI